jgi:hypothetical protein
MLIFFLATGAFLSVYWKINYHFSHKEELVGKSKSIVLWNIARRRDYNIQVLKEVLEKQNVDALFLVEARQKKSEFRITLEEELKGYHIQFLDGNMLVISKGAIEPLHYATKSNTYRFNHLKIKIDSTVLHIGLVDVLNNFSQLPGNLNKKEALGIIIDYAEKNSLDLIIGDFNTPYESINFKTFHEYYNSARTFQNGYTSTWPSSLPLFEIDQIWISKNRDILRMKKAFYNGSDHALMVTYFK